MRSLLCIAGTLAICIGTAGAVLCQTTTTITKTVENPDGTYSVIEYPVGKQVLVNLTPADKLNGASGTASVIRQGDISTINLNLAGLSSSEADSYNVYAVDSAGAVTLLGPALADHGVISQTFTTPLHRFMIFVSPEKNLTAYGPDTHVFFRSAVPTGFAVVPYDGGRHAETIRGPAAGYNVPMLGIPSFKVNDTSKMRINFSGDLAGSHANAFIRPRRDGTTEIKVHFHDLKRSRSADDRIVVWAVAPDNHFVKIGQAMSSGFRNETEIKGETSLKDFGLFITAEDNDVESPTRSALGTFTIER
jgi:hypothetical protein